jgi:hypothetical protein
MSDEDPLSSGHIQRECSRLGHRLGWRFLTCPRENVEGSEAALVTINPGGGSYEEPSWSVETGSAYVIESWNGNKPGDSSLQRQVRRMLEVACLRPEAVLSGYLVPFRSRKWTELNNKKESIKFGIELWREVFRRARWIKVVLAFGKQTAPHLSSILRAELRQVFCAAWGNQTVDLYSFGTSGRLVVLPHLSRYALFNRSKSEEAFLRAYGAKPS